MNVLIVSDVLGKENNGTTIAAYNLVRYLKDKGDNVSILCSDQDKKGQEGFFVVPNLYLGFIINIIVKKNNVVLSRPKTKIIKKALEGIDVVHIMMSFPLGNKTAKIARKMGIPITAGFHCQAQNFTAHLGLMNCKWANELVYHVYYKNLYSKVNAIHYPTDFIKTRFETSIKRKTNAYVISNGVNKSFVPMNIYERDDELNKNFNILFIGRLSKEKTHDILLKAVSLSKYKDNIQLLFAGQGPTEKKILKLANKLGIRKPIIRFYSRDELVRIINQCDLYVHPSKIEIEAISCLEAISCGLVPIISNSIESATKKFAIDEKNLFQFNDPSDLASKIDYWYENPLEKAKRSSEYREFVHNFESTDCMERMYKMLETYAHPINHTIKKTYYYRNALEDDFANNGIQKATIKEGFKYNHKNPFYRFFEFICYYIIAKPVVWFINKIIYHQKIINNLTVKKNEIKGGFIYANHTNSAPDAFTPNLIFHRRNSIITGSEPFSLKGLRTIVSMLGAYPLPETIRGTKNFINGINQKMNKEQFVTIYPEAHIWPYYTKIRDFGYESFRYPINTNKPCICVTNTYVKKGNKLRLVTYVDGPFYPNTSLERNKAKIELRDTIYNVMVKRSNETLQFEKYKYIDLNQLEEEVNKSRKSKLVTIEKQILGQNHHAKCCRYNRLD